MRDTRYEFLDSSAERQTAVLILSITTFPEDLPTMLHKHVW